MKKIVGHVITRLLTLLAAVAVTIPVASAFAAQKLEADMVIVGAGSAGLSAALTAAQGGASVILLEKDKIVGGTGNFAEGVLGVETDMQQFRWHKETKDQVFNNEMDEHRWLTNGALTRRFHNETAKTIDWLQEIGVKFEGPSKNHFDNTAMWHLIDGKGAALIKTLNTQIKKHPGVKLLMETPATGLIVKDKRVIGVKARNKVGETIECMAKGGVIIATGGFANSPEMIKKYAGMDNVINAAPLKKTGDGINMALAVGASVEGMHNLMFIGSMDALPGQRPNIPLGALGVEPRNIWVNKSGKRFANEYVSVNFPLAGNAIKRQKVAWAIIDEKLKDFYKNRGVDVGLGTLIYPATKLDLDDLATKAIAAGNPFVVKAASLSELASKTGLPYDALKQTIAEYNQYAATNHDLAFAKDPRWLQQYNVNGPLYAVKLKEVLLTTVGGVVVDEYLRPLDKDDSILVSGLYMTGNDVGGLYSDTYTLTYASGSSFGFAVNSGRLAALSILKDLGK